jgi:glycosyltransferase involved in cell wall biosynthesis
MNIIMVCESALVTGGAEKVAILEALELSNRGHRVGFIAANQEADPRLSAAGIELLLLDTKSFFEETNRARKIQKLKGNFEIAPKVCEFLSTFEPSETVIHLHTFRLRLSGIVAHLSQEMGFATLVHCHDYSPICPTSLWFDHRKGENCSRSPMSISCITCECQDQPWKYKLPKLTSFFWNQSIWKINRRSRGFIHISSLEQFTTDKASSITTPAVNVPPISSYQSNIRVQAEENESFLFIGRLTQEKGVEQFLQAATKAKAKAVVVGDGPLRNSLEKEFPLVRFTGWLDESGILTELRQARGLVVPSLWRETLCLSVIDAMQCGVPCIVSANVGAKEFISTGINGLIYSDQDIQNAIESMSSDSKVKSLSENAFSTFQSFKPTIKNHVDALCSIYETSLIGGPF